MKINKHKKYTTLLTLSSVIGAGTIYTNLSNVHAAVIKGGSDITPVNIHDKEASGVAMTYTTYGNNQVASGSGVFVAPNIMLTVAHNYLDKDKASGTSFVRGGNGAISYVVMNSDSAKRGNNTSSGYDDIIPKGNIYYYNDKEFVTSYSGDLAAVVTEKPVEAMTNGEDHARSLDVAKQGDKITVMGYPNDFSSKRLSEESKARLVNGKMYKVSGTLSRLDENTGSGTYNTSALGGFSGGPIFNEKGELVGIHQHGTNTDFGDDSSQYGGGLFFTEKHRQWINKMISDHGIKGWFVNGNDKYYYDDNHKALVNTERDIDGAKYRFDGNGRATLISGKETGQVVLKVVNENGETLFERVIGQGEVGNGFTYDFKTDKATQEYFKRNPNATIVSIDSEDINKKFNDSWSKDYASKFSLGKTTIKMIIRGGNKIDTSNQSTNKPPKPDDKIVSETLEPTTEYVGDETKDRGYESKTEGAKGSKTTKTTYEWDDATNNYKEIVSEDIKQAGKTIITIGTKPTTITTTTSFKTKYIADPNQNVGEKVVEQDGKNGTITTETHYTVDKQTGKVSETKGEITNTPPQDKIIKVGTRQVEKKEIIKASVEYVGDESREKGSPNMIENGDGSKIIVTTYTVNEITGDVFAKELDPVIQNPTKTIIKIGTKPLIKFENIDPDIEKINDNTRDIGDNLTIPGEIGSKKITTRYAVNPNTGELSEQSEETIVKKQGKTIIQIGTRNLEKEEMERKIREDAEKAKREQAEKERLDREEAERKAKEQAEKAKREKEEIERKAREQAEKERLAREDAEKAKREKEEIERKAREQAEKERLAREDAEKAKREKEEIERKAREQAEKERLAREEAEKAKREKEEIERLEKIKAEVEKNAKTKEELDRLARESELLRKERLEKEKLEKQAREKAEKERLAKERLEKERLEKEQLEKQTKEKAEQERLTKERLEKEKVEKEQLEKQAREKVEQERLTKEHFEKERLEKEQLEKQAKEKAEKERLEKEQLEKQAKEKTEKEKVDKDVKEKEHLTTNLLKKEKVEKVEKELPQKEVEEKANKEQSTKEPADITREKNNQIDRNPKDNSTTTSRQKLPETGDASNLAIMGLGALIVARRLRRKEQ